MRSLIIAAVALTMVVLFIGAPRASAQFIRGGDCSQDAATLEALEATPMGSFSVRCADGFVTDLDFNGTILEPAVFPVEITRLTKLSVLTVRYGTFRSLPPEIGNLDELVSLDIKSPNLQTLPPEFGDLRALSELDLSSNVLTTIPSEFGNLSELRTLDLSFNSLTTLPPEIGNLSQLYRLNVAHNALTAVPPEIGNLAELDELYLNTNELVSVPPEIGDLSGLVRFDLSRNALTTIPSEFGKLTSLIRLDLWENALTTLPPEFGNLVDLSRLELRDNALSALPPEFANLTSLSGQLDLGGNKLRSLPAGFENLTNISGLDLSDNEFRTLPASVTSLHGLQSLYLESNHLTALPPAIGDLDALFRLDLSDNALESLPAEFANLTSLTGLYLARNSFTEVPGALSRLDRLSSLEMSGNDLTTLPRWIGDLSGLDFLHLDDNKKLFALPPAIGDLSQLTHLNVSGTPLTALPPEIEGLTELSSLDIEDTFIAELPAEIANLPLDVFYVSNTPLRRSLPVVAVRSCGSGSPQVVVVNSGDGFTEPSVSVNGVRIDPADMQITTSYELDIWSMSVPGAGTGPTYEVIVDGVLRTAACPGYQEELTVASSCLANDGRVDFMLVNQDSPARYRIEFPGLSARERTVASTEAWRMPFTGRPDGTYDVAITKTRLADNAETTMNRTVVVDCDGGPPPKLSSEVQIVSYCVAGNGFVRYQFVNPTDADRSYVVKFEGLPNRSSTARGFGASIAGVSGRPDGTYVTTVEYGDQRNVPMYSEVVTVDCDP